MASSSSSSSSTTTARLDYLDRASHSLTLISPALSAHLQSIRQQSLTTTTTTTTTPICTTCSTILLPGWNTTTPKPPHHSIPSPSSTRQDRLSHHRNPVQQLHCTRCGATNSITRAPRPGLRRDHPASDGRLLRPTRASHVLRAPSSSAVKREDDASSSSPNVGIPPGERPSTSRKRGRGKKSSSSSSSSLQAMLASRKSMSATAGFGLGMSDFLK